MSEHRDIYDIGDETFDFVGIEEESFVEERKEGDPDGAGSQPEKHHIPEEKKETPAKSNRGRRKNEKRSETTGEVGMLSVNYYLRLSERQHRLLKRASSLYGCSMSVVVRDAIDAHLKKIMSSEEYRRLLKEFLSESGV